MKSPVPGMEDVGIISSSAYRSTDEPILILNIAIRLETTDFLTSPVHSLNQASVRSIDDRISESFQVIICIVRHTGKS